jgi:L-ornithine N5-monooxygenase
MISAHIITLYSFGLGSDMGEIETIGIGVGPANLAFLTAILDHAGASMQPENVIFLERSEKFRWQYQRDDFGRLQLPYLKDLATQRNPRSRFTFLNFLHEHNRLEAFINLRDLFPALEEIAEYLAWVANLCGNLIRFDCDVKRIEAVYDDNGNVDRLKLTVRNAGVMTSYYARTIILGCGRNPHIPLRARSAVGNRMLHTAGADVGSLDRLMRICAEQPLLIVGSGQSALETALRLLDLGLPRTEVYLRGSSPRAIDDNPFVNFWYQTAGAKRFAELNTDARRAILQELAGTNRGVVERTLLDELFRRQYDGLRAGVERISFRPRQSLVDVREIGDGIVCVFEHTDTKETTEVVAGGVVLATGYDGPDLALLDDLLDWIEIDGNGWPSIGSDRCLKTRNGFRPRIFINGNWDHYFGPADSTFSTIAQRGGDLFRSVFEARQ